MKHLLKKLFLLTLSLSLLVSGMTVKANDATVKYSFAKDTLTISGTGVADTFDTSVCHPGNIKKVVIKKGITRLGAGALPDMGKVKSITIASTVKTIDQNAIWCEKLDKLTMPGDFKCYVPPKSSYEDEEDYSPLPAITRNTVAGSLHLNTPIKKMNQTKYMSFRAKKIYTAKSDKKYKSYKGMIYTKSGKKLVYVPSGMSNVNVRKGCKTISMRAMTYSRNVQGEDMSLCEFTKVTLPSSIRSVVNDTFDPGFDQTKSAKWTIKSKKINGSGIANLALMLSQKNMNKLYKKSKNIKKTKGMWITKNHILVSYKGKAKTVTVPKGVKTIWDSAFSENHKIKSIKFPKSLKTIKDWAFFRCYNLKTVKWNKKLKSIGEAAFQITALKTFKLPSSVKNFGESCFEGCKLTKIVFPKSMKKIPAGMFGGAKVKNLVIPGHIKTIGRYAFADSKMETLTFNEGVEEIGSHAFDMCGNIKTVTLAKSVKTIDNAAFIESGIGLLVVNGAEPSIARNICYDVKEIDVGSDPTKFWTLPYMNASDDNPPYDIDFAVVKVKSATGFEVEMATNQNFSDAVKKELPNESNTVKVQRPSKDYTFYRIRVYTLQDGNKVYGPWTDFGW